MYITYNFDLLPVLLALVVITIVVLWVAIQNYKNFLVMLLIIPLTIASGWTIYTTVDALLGYPTYAEMTADSQYEHHIEDRTNELIYIWLYEPGSDRPKAIIVPLTEDNKKQAEAAAEGKEKGIPQFLKPKGDVAGEGQTQGGEFETYDFQPTGDQNQIKDEQRRREAQEALDDANTQLPAGPVSGPISSPTRPRHGGTPRLSSETPETFMDDPSIITEHTNTDKPYIAGPVYERFHPAAR